MKIKRIIGRLAPRWIALLLAGLVGAAGAFIFAQQRNSEVVPVYAAQASVEIPVADTATDSRGGRSSDAVPDELAVALDIAETVNEEALMEEGKTVETDTEQGTLVFTATAPTEAGAIADAINLRSAYVAADPIFDADSELAKKLNEADEISARLDDLIPEPVEPVEPTAEEVAIAEAQLEILTARETSLNAKIAELSDLRIDATDEAEIAAIDEDLAKYQEQLRVLLIELRPLQVVEEPPAQTAQDEDPLLDALPTSDQWTIQALQARLAELETESAGLIVASVTGQNVVLPETMVTDQTPRRMPIPFAVIAGFIAGLILWSAVVVMFDRAKGVVWAAGDVKALPVLTEAPAYSLGSSDLTDIERQRRKKSVQAIRSAIISASQGEGTVVGFAAPLSTESLVREDLAYDVAASVSAVGRTVLVVDLGFREKSGLEAFLMGEGGGLRELFDSVADDEETIKRRAASVLAGADTLSPGLDVLVADADVIDPADILAGRPLSELLDQARQHYDIVIVVQPTTTVVSGAGVDAYLQQQVIVATRGKTTVSEIAAEAIPISASRVQLVGIAIAVPELGFGKSRRDSESSVYSQSKESPPDSYYPEPESRSAGNKIASASGGRNEGSEGTTPGRTVDRLRALETYTVDESAFAKSSEPPADSA